MQDMRRKWFVALALFVGLISGQQAFAQDAAAQQNAQKARAAIDAMITALGGDRWLTMKNRLWAGRTSGFYHGSPTGGITDYWEYHAFPDQDRIEFGKHRDVLQIYTGREGWEVTYRGKSPLPKDQQEDWLRRRDHSIEVALRVWFKDPKTILVYEGQQLVERHLAEQVTLISPSNDSITIQMDHDTHLPLRRSFQWRDPVYKDKDEDAEEYDDYHNIEGFPTPFTITRFRNGDMVNQRFLYSADYNVNVPPDLFNPDQAAAKVKK
jgi:hypothetical protein